jgi:D-lactate dehydrogenase
MKVAVFGTRRYDREFLSRANARFGHELSFLEPRLDPETAALAAGYPAVCLFVNDRADAAVLVKLAANGVRIIALRCAGTNNVDLATAGRLGIRVARVPAYSPYAVAEHTVALMLALNRKICRANARVHEGNFSLDGLLGFDMRGRTVGIVGTGKIGAVLARILHGFGMTLLAHDRVINPDCTALGVRYVPLAELFSASDVITLHCPLTADTRHMINQAALASCKPGLMLINTGRGGLIDTRAAIEALKSGRLGSLGLDVYEEEADLFFDDHSDTILTDDVFARLLTFPNVLITGHQAFFTETALTNIAETTLGNLTAFETGQPLVNEVRG